MTDEALTEDSERVNIPKSSTVNILISMHTSISMHDIYDMITELQCDVNIWKSF